MPINAGYKLCARCVMDTTDPFITFDDQGYCNHCRCFYQSSHYDWFPNEQGQLRLKALLGRIRGAGQNRNYDCILGLSGGVDSSYLAIKVKEWGLRPLVMHVDAGWNSEAAVANIEAIVKFCGYDLHTHVVDWEEMRDLQQSFLWAAVSNQDVPQDHAFFSNLYHYAAKNGIHYILSGGNLATEGIFPSSWHGSAMDAINLQYIHRCYGTKKLNKYKTINFVDCYLWYPLIKKLRTVRPLNYIYYNKNDALNYLKEVVGYKPYQRKHGESHFTKFFQNYYLPAKFGFDKRRPHLSSLIVSGQISRDRALAILDEPLYDPLELDIDTEYICKKLRLTQEDFSLIMKAPIHDYKDFPNWERRYKILKMLQQTLRKVFRINLKVYS